MTENILPLRINLYNCVNCINKVLADGSASQTKCTDNVVVSAVLVKKITAKKINASKKSIKQKKINLQKNEFK